MKLVDLNFDKRIGEKKKSAHVTPDATLVHSRHLGVELFFFLKEQEGQGAPTGD
jgi:hypothetical protein